MTKWIVDAIAVLGVGLIGYGIWLIYHPASYITVGLIITATAVMWTLAEDTQSNKKE